jgi:hypothetical protein
MRRQRTSIRLGLEDEIYRLRIVAGDGHLLNLLTLAAVPRSDRAVARGQGRQLEFSFAHGDGVVQIFRDCENAFHPRVNIAFHENEFRAGNHDLEGEGAGPIRQGQDARGNIFRQRACRVKIQAAPVKSVCRDLRIYRRSRSGGIDRDATGALPAPVGAASGVVISVSIRCQYLWEELRENCEI